MQECRNRRLSTSSGFTLIELAITMGIIAILTITVAPVFQKQLAHFNLVQTAYQITADLRELQQRALTENSTDYNIQFYRNAVNHYTIRKQTRAGPINIKATYFASSVKLGSTNFPSDRLYISAVGSPYPHGGTIIIENRRSGEAIYVIIASITGRVRVSWKPPEEREDYYSPQR